MKLNRIITRTFFNRIKLLYAKTFKKTSSFGYPDKLQIEPTNYCNAGCPLCPTGSGRLKRIKGFMDINLYKKIIDEVAGKTTHITLWNYGEPFLHPKIFEMIKYAKMKGLELSLSTNGYVFYKEENNKKLIISDLDVLIVSLDGATKEIFSMYRKNVDFEKVINGLKKLKLTRKKSGITRPIVDIQFIVMKHNEHEIAKMKEIAYKLGDRLTFKTVNTQMVKGVNILDWIPKNQIYSRYYINNPESFIPKKQNIHNCPYIWYSLVINWDGTVNPCCYDYQSDYIVGHLYNQPVKDIWTGQKMKDFRSKVLIDRRQNTICRNCNVDLYKDRLIYL